MARTLHNLQVLRAYAAISVAYFHLFTPVFNVGRFGVDVFFVISGFIMSLVCFSRPEHFLSRRIIRIVPIYWIYTLALFTVSVLAPALLKSVTPSLPNLLRSLLFIPYVKENGLVNPLVPPGWTLNYEMYFYVLVAFCIPIFRPRLATLAASALMVAIGATLRWKESGPIAAFYADSIIGEFCLGVAAFWLWQWNPTVRPVAGVLTSLILLSGLALILSEYFHVEARIPTGRFAAFGLPALVLVLSSLFLERSRKIASRALLLVGDASYSLYLSHMFVIEFMGREE